MQRKPKSVGTRDVGITRISPLPRVARGSTRTVGSEPPLPRGQLLAHLAQAQHVGRAVLPVDEIVGASGDGRLLPWLSIDGHGVGSAEVLPTPGGRDRVRAGVIVRRKGRPG